MAACDPEDAEAELSKNGTTSWPVVAHAFKEMVSIKPAVVILSAFFIVL